jgi:hypothetical protein
MPLNRRFSYQRGFENEKNRLSSSPFRGSFGAVLRLQEK